MLYIRLENGIPVQIVNGYSELKGSLDSRTLNPKWARRHIDSDGWITARDLESFEEMTILAEYLTQLTGDLYLPCDEGEYFSPRYDLIKAPKVGEKVSYAFNGDCYPDGEIVRITKNWMIVTSTGSRYNRTDQGKGGGWTKVGGTWSLVQGHRYTQNPEF